MEYRKGMWVTVGGHVGILAEPDPRSETAEVHFTDDQGCTALVQPAVPFAQIAQAAWADIPEPRRPDEATARRFGYL